MMDALLHLLLHRISLLLSIWVPPSDEMPRNRASMAFGAPMFGNLYAWYSKHKVQS